MTRRRRHHFKLAGLAAILSLASASALAQSAAPGLRPPAPAMQAGPAAALQPIVLDCQMTHIMFGPGMAKVTNLGAATLAPGRVISVAAVEAGSSGANFALSAPLPPGGSVSIPLTGSSTLARGCVANAG